MVYLPPHFEVTDPGVMEDAIAASPLGLLITVGSQGLAANHIPFVIDSAGGGHGRLLGHVARNNDVWHDHDPEHGALVVFHTVDAYISPNWYVTKRTTHEVVPTWNYAVVHVYGSIIVHDDAKWVRGQAGMLTRQMESSQPIPWKMADAPRLYTDAQLQGIVGIEISIHKLVGKFKASQNRDAADLASAVEGLRATNIPDNEAMADVMELAHRLQ